MVINVRYPQKELKPKPYKLQKSSCTQMRTSVCGSKDDINSGIKLQTICGSRTSL